MPKVKPFQGSTGVVDVVNACLAENGFSSSSQR